VAFRKPQLHWTLKLQGSPTAAAAESAKEKPKTKTALKKII
jgi:hypothetical protein